MTEYREIIRRLRESQSIRAIQRETGIHRTIIRKLNKKAEKEGWLNPGSPLPSEEILYQEFEKRVKAAPHPLDVKKEKIKKWVEDKKSYVVIHQLLKDTVNCSEATVRRYIRKNFPKHPKVVMRRETIAGEIMEVDFGYLGICLDPLTGKRRKTYVFSGRLRHSRDAYRETVYNQKQETFFDCHINAFEYFGGVPKIVVPDNLKAAVIKASFECPIINRAYHKLAEHYNFMISPNLPRMPQHKGGVENDIKYVKNNFWPIFKERQKDKGYSDPNGQELAIALEKWNREIARIRKIGGVGRTPEEIFETEEKTALQLLPGARWKVLHWGVNINVQETNRIQYCNAYYSVPYKYVGQEVDVLSDTKTVYIFHDHKQIAIHRKAAYDWEFLRKSEHFPVEMEKHMHTTREGLKRLASEIGPSVSAVAGAILDNKHIDGLRPARKMVFSLKKKYGKERLEAACARALAYDTIEYNSVKSILVKELDKLDIEEAVDSEGNKLFAFARKSGYFDPLGTLNEQGESKWMN